jgi:hypothetical protein
VTDEEFLQALESCKLPESQFGHAAHVRAAYDDQIREETAGIRA